MSGFVVPSITVGTDEEYKASIERINSFTKYAHLDISDGDFAPVFLVEPENSKSYTEKINKLFEDKAELRNFGKQARQFVVDNYSWEIIIRRYLEEIKSVSGEKDKLEK